MNARINTLLALLLCLAGLGGCGDDGSDAPATRDDVEGDGDGDTSADGGEPTEMDDDPATGSCVAELDPLDLAPPAPPKYTCDAEPSSNNPDSANACRNDADCVLIDTEKVRRLAKECALSCRGTTVCADAELCNQNCLNSATMQQLGGMLTGNCASCYAQAALCGLENCYAECADDADSLDCVECSFKKGCRLPFERCSGLDRQD
jgi:hypothetical protein